MPREAKLFSSSSGSVVRGFLKFRASISARQSRHARSAVFRSSVHTEYKALDGRRWVDEGDLWTGLSRCRRGREHKQQSETQNSVSNHAYILPEVNRKF